ncbi:MAG: sulfotransferase family protein [Haliea sp.]|nr:sulfotransferase family protein [Haliea sp.]
MRSDRRTRATHGYFEFEPVKKLGKQNDWVEHAGGKAVKIVAQLLPMMPPRREKRIIFMARPLGEIVGSQAQMLERLGRKGAAISNRQLAAIYKKQVETLSKSLARRNGLAAITIDYTEAIADPQSTARRVNQFLGGALDERAMAAVIDESLYRARLEGE